MTLRMKIALCSALLTVCVLPTFLNASDGSQARVQFFQSIDVGPDEQVGDVVCIVCSIHMAGTASGDTVAILGSVFVEGKANGDVVAVGGSVRLGEDASVGGETVGLGGGVSRHPNAVVKGDVVSQANPLFFLLLFVAAIVMPLLPIALIVWLIVWLVRSNRSQPYSPAPYRR